MPPARSTSSGRRGPVAAQPSRSPSGYRISDRQRFELDAAGLFTGRGTLQSVLDLAVQEFLDRMRSVDGFAAALDAAEREQQRRTGVRQVRTEPGVGD